MEIKLLKLSFIVSIIGILILFFFSEMGEIDGTIENEDDIVKVIGNVERITKGKNVSFLTLVTQNELGIVAFDDVNLTIGAKIEVIGKVSDGSVVASRIRLISS